MRCPHCRAIVWTPQQAYIHALKRAGLCANCKCPRGRDGHYCAACLVIVRERSKTRRAVVRAQRLSRERQRMTGQPERGFRGDPVDGRGHGVAAARERILI